MGDLCSIPGSGGSPVEGKGYPLHYSDLENSMHYIVPGIANSGTRLRDFHFCCHFFFFNRGRRALMRKQMTFRRNHWALRRTEERYDGFGQCPTGVALSRTSLRRGNGGSRGGDIAVHLL